MEKREPMVGIFWLINGKLILDGVPVSSAERYGAVLGYPTGHVDYWAKLQRDGVVPVEVEYEEHPRGRVLYHAEKEEFVLLADKCILLHKKAVCEVRRAFSLPDSTVPETDCHYRCYRCLYQQFEM